MVARIEQGSEHPLAEAFVDYARNQNIELLPVEKFEALTGLGVKAIVDGTPVLFGNAKLMLENSVDIDNFFSQAQTMADKAQTVMYLAVNEQLQAILAVSDPVKEDSKLAIKRLKSIGLKVYMLTGDNKHTANAVAKTVGIDEVMSEVLPGDKDSKVAQLQQQGEVVAMVGDGINDAPALARADVGFAIGTGTDVAIESADITLMSGSIHGVVNAIEVSNATVKNIKQNLFGAFIYNSLGIPLAAGVLFPFFGILLNPMIAGAAMAMSSVTVVSNANRLRFFRPGV